MKLSRKQERGRRKRERQRDKPMCGYKRGPTVEGLSSAKTPEMYTESFRIVHLKKKRLEHVPTSSSPSTPVLECVHPPSRPHGAVLWPRRQKVECLRWTVPLSGEPELTQNHLPRRQLISEVDQGDVRHQKPSADVCLPDVCPPIAHSP